MAKVEVEVEPDEEDTDVGARPTSRFSPRRIVVGMVLTATVIGLGIGVYLGISAFFAENGAKASAHATVAPPPVAPRPASTTAAMPPVTVGLRDGHVVRLHLHCQMHPDDVYRFEERKMELKALVKDVVKDYQSSDLEGIEGKNRLRDELLTKLNARIGEPMIERVYFEDFLIQ